VSAPKDLYASHIGSDMVLEGERSPRIQQDDAQWRRILELSGHRLRRGGRPSQRSPEQLNANIKILDSQTATLPCGSQPVMELPEEYKAGTDFQGIFIHNDDMGTAHRVLKAAGVKPGDLKIVSVDAHAAVSGHGGWLVPADVECNPCLPTGL